jgi:serine/threonine-protein kinase
VGQATSDPGQSATDLGSWIGRVIDDRYRIVEVLGEGGMGAVFVADHLRLHKQVALKIIRAEFAEHSQAEARFAREALATAQIDHPHVASAIDFGHLPEGGAFLVLALVRGENLGKRLARGALPWPDVCTLGAQIADALATAHAAGIIHRDLKPENVLLETRGDGSLHAKVVDFGIARVSGELGGVVTSAGEPITRLGAVIGSPGYMAPEQAVGGQIDHRVDLYALGVILWECSTGQPLWEADSISELFTSQLSRPAPSLRTGLADALPGDLAGLIDQLLARNPAQRPDAAASVRDRLRRIAREAAPLPAPSPTPPAAERSPVTRGGTTLGDKQASKSMRPALWGLGALLVIVALFFAFRREHSPASASSDSPTRQGRAEPSKPHALVKRELPSRKQVLAEVPDAYTEAAQALLLSDDPKDREQAGEAILGAPDSQAIPEFLKELARLETVDDCPQRRPILLKIEASGDIRALWGLRILDASRRDGFGCIRADLARITAAFEAAAG